MDPLEFTAVLFGVVSVWLSTRQHIVSWPTALVNTALYFIVFQRAQLYANMGLQVVYFTLSCYGWYEWKFGGADHAGVVVARTPRRLALRLLAIAVVVAVALGYALARWTDASLAWLDSGTTAASLVAQWMMTRKLLENWLIWIPLNVVYIGMYFSQGLKLTAGLYVAFFVLALMGYWSWRTSLRARLASAARPATAADLSMTAP
jgi:nicotinamide mononucleotide transporter